MLRAAIVQARSRRSTAPGLPVLVLKEARRHITCVTVQRRLRKCTHLHQEMDLTVQANLPTPGKVDAAKAGCGHESSNQEGRHVVLLSLLSAT